MSGSRSVTTAQPSPPPQHRAEQQTLNNRSYATPVTSPPLPVPRPGSRAAAPPPGGGRTFLDLRKARELKRLETSAHESGDVYCKLFLRSIHRNDFDLSRKPNLHLMVVCAAFAKD